MMLTLVSLGINSHMDMSLKGLEKAKQANKVYAEIYTMKMDTTIPELEELIGKKVTPLPRGGMEEHSERLINEAKTQDVVDNGALGIRPSPAREDGLRKRRITSDAEPPISVKPRE